MIESSADCAHLIKGMTISPPPQSVVKDPAQTWPLARKAALVLTILGLAGTNIATLLSDNIHAAAHNAVSSALRTLPLTQTMLSGLLSSNPTAVRATETQAATTALAKKHDELRRDYDAEIRRHADLKQEHLNLKQRHLALAHEHKLQLASNKAQLEKSAAQSATARAISARMATRSAANAMRNASSVPAEAIPVVGTAIVLGVTAWDLKDACETLKDLNELNTSFNHQPVDHARVCGMTVPTQEEVVNNIRDNWKAIYNDAARQLGLASSPQSSESEIKTRFCSTFRSITGFCH